MNCIRQQLDTLNEQSVLIARKNELIRNLIDRLPLSKYDAELTKEESVDIGEYLCYTVISIPTLNEVFNHISKQISSIRLLDMLVHQLSKNKQLNMEFVIKSLWTPYLQGKHYLNCIINHICNAYNAAATPEEKDLWLSFAVPININYSSKELEKAAIDNILNHGAIPGIEILHKNTYRMVLDIDRGKLLFDVFKSKRLSTKGTRSFRDVLGNVISNSTPIHLQQWVDILVSGFVPEKNDINYHIAYLLGVLLYKTPMQVNKISKEVVKYDYCNENLKFDFGNMAIENSEFMTAGTIVAIFRKMRKQKTKLVTDTRWINTWLNNTIRRTKIPRHQHDKSFDNVAPDIKYVTSDGTEYSTHRILLQSKMNKTLPVFRSQKVLHLPFHSDYWKHVIDFSKTGVLNEISEETLRELAQISQKIGFTSLNEIACIYLCMFITIENVDYYYNLAKRNKSIWLSIMCLKTIIS